MGVELKIVDERCSCGHLKSEHGPSEVSKLKLVMPPEVLSAIKGHGKCTKCDCKKFTWVEFIYGKR